VSEHSLIGAGSPKGTRLGGSARKGHRLLAVGAATLLATGLTIVGFSVSAFAAGVTGTMTVTPSTGLTGGQSVAVAGTGFTKSSIGNLLECNNAPNEPTAMLGAPISTAVAVGCTAPSLTQLVQTDATGAITAGTTFKVAQGTIGPPCGAAPAAVTCPATDSAGQSPAADAANYPCPPTAAQQAAGVVCQLNYGDAAGDSAVVNLSFAGSTPPPSSTTTTAAATTATPTTKAPTATTVAPATGAGGGTTTPTAAPSATTGTLAATGPGPGVGLMGVVGGVVLLLGLFLLLMLLNVPQRAFAGIFDRQAARRVKAPRDESQPGSLGTHITVATRRVVSVSSRTAAWFLGR
jgi:hypothetical protein